MKNKIKIIIAIIIITLWTGFCIYLFTLNIKESKCPYCTSANQQAQYCTQCGKELYKTCDICNKRLNERDLFCPDCGSKANDQ